MRTQACLVLVWQQFVLRRCRLYQEPLEENEVERYLREPLAPEQTLTLDYWKQNLQRYPIISKFARAFLAVQASSVESEREFSIAGDVISINRSVYQSQYPGS